MRPSAKDAAVVAGPAARDVAVRALRDLPGRAALQTTPRDLRSDTSAKQEAVGRLAAAFWVTRGAGSTAHSLRSARPEERRQGKAKARRVPGSHGG